MITPNAFRLIIKHINELDKRISTKLLTKKPWDEISLTSALSDLFDEETQVHENIQYDILKLKNDLLLDNGLIGVKLSLNTTEFSSSYERYVSEADLGLKIVFENLIEPKLSWEKSYLLQAKKIFPTSKNPTSYDEGSSFSAMDNEQIDRIKILQRLIGNSFLFLLYCPRPENLHPDVAQKLLYLRLKTLKDNIFDYVQGFELHSELSKSQETIASGIFVSNPNLKIQNLAFVHENIFKNTFPLSWFIAMKFFDQRNHHGSVPVYLDETNVSDDQKRVVERIIDGDEEIIELVKKEYQGGRIPEKFTIYPKHTLTLRYSVGESINPNHRLITTRNE